MLKWKHVYGVMTPGGDPAWECPNCGFEHVYGIENYDCPYYVCPKCGNDIIYPYENFNDNRQVVIETRFNPEQSEKMLEDLERYKNSKCSKCAECSLLLYAYSGNRHCMAPYLRTIDLKED